MTAEPPASQRFALGLMFLPAFRWLLLLLFSLILEKAAESVTIGFTADGPAYVKDAVVYAPMFGDQQQQWHFSANVNWRYVAGLVQIFITLLFAAKYFVCLVDPLERFAGIRDGLPLAEKWKQAREAICQEVTGFHIAMIALIAIPEFVLLFHAATAIAVYRQWLMFLLLLVLWDSIAFFVLIELLSRIRVWWLRGEKKFSKLKRWSRGVSFLRVMFRTLENGSDGVASEVAQRFVQTETDLAAELAQKEATLKLIVDKRPNADYGPWNYLDALVLIIGLCLDVDDDISRWGHFLSDRSDMVGLGVTLAFGAVLAWTLLRPSRALKHGQADTGVARMRFVLISILFGLLLLLACVVMHLLLPAHVRSTEWTRTVMLAVLFGVSVVFLRSNYRSQEELWQRHLLLLQLS